MKQDNTLFIILTTFFILICISISTSCTVFHEYVSMERKLENLEKEVTELQTQVDGYIDNYIALWNTINNKERRT